MRVIKWLDENFEEYAMIGLLMLLSVVMMLQIIMRYVFGSSLPWPEEFSRYTFVWSAFLSVGLSIKKGIMLKIDLLVQILPKTFQKVFELFIQVLSTLFMLYFLYQSVPVVSDAYLSGQTSPAMGIPMYFMFSSIVIGFALGLFRSSQQLVIMLKNFTAKDLAEGSGKD